VNGFNIIYQQYIPIVRSAVTGPESSWVFTCQHTKLSCYRWLFSF